MRRPQFGTTCRQALSTYASPGATNSPCTPAFTASRGLCEKRRWQTLPTSPAASLTAHSSPSNPATCELGRLVFFSSPYSLVAQTPRGGRPPPTARPRVAPRDKLRSLSSPVFVGGNQRTASPGQSTATVWRLSHCSLRRRARTGSVSELLSYRLPPPRTECVPAAVTPPPRLTMAGAPWPTVD